MCVGNYENLLRLVRPARPSTQDHLMDDHRPMMRVPDPPAMDLAIRYLVTPPLAGLSALRKH